MNCANHPDRERVAFCQDCGKPLCQECVRTVGSSIYCEQSLAARLSGAGAPPPSGGGSYTYTGGEGGPNYTVPGPIPPPPIPGEPNPGLAALLGFIPGVGAMYNGQYAKGVVHLIVFAILVSLADEHGIFGLFIAGWVCYQVIEAHHTARARRDGTPLPNPFGLNDLGERLGFGKSWPSSSGSTTQQNAATDSTSSTTSTPPPAPGYPSQTQSQAQSSSASWSVPWDSYAPPVPPIPPYGTTPGYPVGAPGYPIDPNLVPAPRNRFPAGAIWLIGLGCLFLIGNAGLFHTFPIHKLVPFFLIGLGVWLFVHKMTDTGPGLADDGTPGYQFRLFRALRGSVWVTLIGVLFLLDSFDILPWGRSWPVIIIVAGLMLVFQRISYSSVMAAPYPYPPPPAPPPPPSDPGTSILPSTQHDQEGR
jgi:cell wall-active antibiotic response 4TMS protein YvqF/B-box zinc finger protein